MTEQDPSTQTITDTDDQSQTLNADQPTARPKVKTPYILPNVTIGPMVAEGKCIVKHEGLVIFVEGAVPGDQADIRIYKQKKSFAEGALFELLSASPERVQPHCEHFGVCGGCKWQHMSYHAQLTAKQQQVIDALERIGNLSNLPTISPILGAPSTTYYRNKLEFSASNKKWLTKDEVEHRKAAKAEALANAEVGDAPLTWPEDQVLGFHAPGVFDKVLDINHCHHMPDPANAIRLAIKQYALDHHWAFGDLRKHTGLLRSVMLRSTNLGQWMVVVQFYYQDDTAIDGLFGLLKAQFPMLTSIQYVINNKHNDTIYDLEVVCWDGLPYIIEEMEGLQFRIGAKSFFQTNSAQALALYQITRKMAGLTGKEVVYDLYTGTGTIAQFVAKQARKVIGIESVEMAVEDARVNAAHNGLDNCTFFAGDMRHVFTDAFVATHGQPDVVITDPPRAGMHADVVAVLARLKPKVIVYVSCNPATQARDLALLQDLYTVTDVQPVDMFPHTIHVENVVRLVLK